MSYISEIKKEHIRCAQFNGEPLFRTKATIGVVYDSDEPVAEYISKLAENRLNFVNFDILYMKPKKIILNGPATIIIWVDGTKTVVKCDKDDTYDPEKGIALCFMKKAMNNKSNYNNVFKEWIK